jgi:hypothetical protein
LLDCPGVADTPGSTEVGVGSAAADEDVKKFGTPFNAIGGSNKA